MSSISVPADRAPIMPSTTTPEMLSVAKRMYAVARTRERVFGTAASLFGDPAWFMLLDLFIAGEGGRRVSVSSACLAAYTPATSGIRCVVALEDRGLIYRTIDPKDRRCSFLQLTGQGTALMRHILAADGQFCGR